VAWSSCHPPGAEGDSILGIAWAGIVFHQAYREVLDAMERDFEVSIRGRAFKRQGKCASCLR
jgi:hypothetical protein